MRAGSGSNRRRTGLAVGPMVAAVVACLAVEAIGQSTGFDVTEASLTELADALKARTVTSRQLVDMYLARIEAYDKAGPRLNAIITINPRARAEAEALDRERSGGGPRGPLHGIPVIVKDNYGTRDMPTTGGSIALKASVPSADAFQVRKLRDAGAIILAKANMHEFGYGITTVSSVGGQTLNPYDVRRNPGGSSGGVGAGIAASFAAVGMGSDTCGSIRIPSAHNNLVGLRPTPGVSSGTGIIPMSHTQDVAGPLARTVTDLAITLDATVGADPEDLRTMHARGALKGAFSEVLRVDSLRGARIGLFLPLVDGAPEDQAVARVIRAALADMTKRGAETVEVSVPGFDALIQGASVLQREFKFDVNEYLQKVPGADARSIAEILERRLHHPAVEPPLRGANGIATLNTREYALALEKRTTVRDAIVRILDERQLTALAYPTLRRTAAPVGEPQRGNNCSLSATSGLPAISVPAGFADDGLPVGLELLGRPFADVELVQLAFAYEQATHHRRPPPTTPGLVRLAPGR